MRNFILSWSVVGAVEIEQFSKNYYLVGNVKIPYINLEMPLEVIASEHSQKISYYRGLQVEYQGEEGEFKAVYNITDRICMANIGGTGEHVGVTVLPDLSTYEYAGMTVLNGILCKKFVQNKARGKTGQMDDHIEFYYDPLEKKPVRWHMHSRFKLWNSHTDEWILDYLEYVEMKHDFKITPPEECKKAIQTNFTMQAHGIFPQASAPSSDDDLPLPFLRPSARNHIAQKISHQPRDIVAELNAKHPHTRFRHNRYSNMTVDEVLKYRGGGKPRKMRDVPGITFLFHSEENPPSHFDWRVEKPEAIGPVKDQAFCGSCWAFSLVAAVEGIQAVKTGKLTLLADQMVVDCAWSPESRGCLGGLSDDATIQLVKYFKGVIPTASSYGSYLSVDGYCKPAEVTEVGARLTGWVYVKHRDENAVLQALVQEGPLAVGLNVVDEMLYYDSGVLNVESCAATEDIDHAVALVGYGTDPESSLNYYTIRNSWSTHWGEEGYIRIVRGAWDCGISSTAGYPMLDLDQTVYS